MKIDRTANINPFEGQPIFFILLILFFILLFSALMIGGLGKVLAIVLIIPVIFLLILIAYGRLAAKWRIIHFPLSFRYAGAMGYVQRYQNLTIDEKMDLALMSVLKGVYLSRTKDEVTQYYEQLMNQLPNFMDQKMMEIILKRKISRITDEELNKLSKYFSNKGKDEKFKKVWLVISDVIKQKYGEDEKQEYIFSIIKGKAI